MTSRGLACLVVATLACGAPAEQSADSEQRQVDVARQGAAVMPFDLDRTTHSFEKFEEGGLQTVVADDGDPEQVLLIRRHLAEEAGRFGRGDFHDPAMIHGDDMPGLHSLVTRHEQLTVTYSEVSGGAEIDFASEDQELVAAIHLWFDAQLLDHGEHAQPHR